MNNFAAHHDSPTQYSVTMINPQLKCLWFPSVSLLYQILIGEVTNFFVKTEGAQEKTIVTADCCYFNPLLRRIVRFLGKLQSQRSDLIVSHQIEPLSYRTRSC